MKRAAGFVCATRFHNTGEYELSFGKVYVLALINVQYLVTIVPN